MAAGLDGVGLPARGDNIRLPGPSPTVLSERLACNSRTLLAALIHAGQLRDLRWPDFSDYRAYLTDFYRLSGYTPAWVKEGQPTPQAATAIETSQNADQEGLNAEDYDGPRCVHRIACLQQSGSGPTAADPARLDLALTVSLMRLVSDVHMGRVNPRYFHSGFNIGPAKYGLAELLRQWITDGQDIRAALAIYIRLAQEDDGEQLPATGKSVQAGEDYPGVLRLVRLLWLLGDLPPDTEAPMHSTPYSGSVVEAVKRFQRRHGLDPDGGLG